MLQVVSVESSADLNLVDCGVDREEVDQVRSEGVLAWKSNLDVVWLYIVDYKNSSDDVAMSLPWECSTRYEIVPITTSLGRVSKRTNSAVMHLTLLLQLFGLPSFLRIGRASFICLPE